MLGTPAFSSAVVVVVVVVVVLLYRPAHAQNSAPGLAFSLVFCFGLWCFLRLWKIVPEPWGCAVIASAPAPKT